MIPGIDFSKNHLYPRAEDPIEEVLVKTILLSATIAIYAGTILGWVDHPNVLVRMANIKAITFISLAGGVAGTFLHWSATKNFRSLI